MFDPLIVKLGEYIEGAKKLKHCVEGNYDNVIDLPLDEEGERDLKELKDTFERNKHHIPCTFDRNLKTVGSYLVLKSKLFNHDMKKRIKIVEGQIEFIRGSFKNPYENIRVGANEAGQPAGVEPHQGAGQPAGEGQQPEGQQQEGQAGTSNASKEDSGVKTIEDSKDSKDSYKEKMRKGSYFDDNNLRRDWELYNKYYDKYFAKGRLSKEKHKLEEKLKALSDKLKEAKQIKILSCPGTKEDNTENTKIRHYRYACCNKDDEDDKESCKTDQKYC